MASLMQLILAGEAKSYEVHRDPTRRGRPSVGIGHLVRTEDKLKLGDKIDEARLKLFFRKDATAALAAARRQAGRAGIKSAKFIVTLSAVNFDLGARWYLLQGQKKTWAQIMDGNYDEAAMQLAKSAWFKQSPKRGKLFQRGLRLLPAGKK
jgi:GH24 family phage-related lysozyme (muramidase)